MWITQLDANEYNMFLEEIKVFEMLYTFKFCHSSERQSNVISEVPLIQLLENIPKENCGQQVSFMKFTSCTKQYLAMITKSYFQFL